MSEKNNKYTPNLRFPEFSGEWEEKSVGDCLEERNEQFSESSEYPLMAFVADKGVSPKGEKYDRSALVKDANKKYKRTEYGDFIYSSNNLESGSIGFNKYGSATISPVYSIFKSRNNVNPVFIGTLLTQKSFISEMVKYRQGIVYGQWKIPESEFLKIKIFIPKTPVEQQKIASCLSAMDDLIAAQAEKVEALKEKKTGLMQQLFPQPGETTPRLRFPEFTGEWDEITFGELIEESRETSTVENEGILLTSSIEGMFLNSEIFSHQRGSTTIGYRKIKKGMLVLSAQNLHLGNANVNMRFDSGLVSPAYKVYRIIGCLPQYLAHWVKRTATKQFFLDATTQGASECRKNVVWDQLYKQMLTIPSPAEQQKIASCLSALDDQIAAETEKFTALKDYKKGLMQQLFPQPAK